MAEAVPPRLTAKGAVKAVVGPCARAAWPAVEAWTSLGARMKRGPRSVTWHEAWNAELDAVLDALPALPGCTRDHYRELMHPTGVTKRHAVVSENGAPIALISLRRRRNFWEPVACQSLPGAIAPAIDHAALARAIAVLGLEIRVAFGLGADAHEYGARLVYPYNVHRLPLEGDYEAHWRLHKNMHMRAVKKARDRCAEMQVRIDGEGDLDWIIANWAEAWKDDPEQEVLATPDRLRFWKALRASPAAPGQLGVHTVTVLEGDKRVAGCVHTSLDDTVTFQSTARDESYENLGVGTRVMDASIAWAHEKGFKTFDLGSGSYKLRWAPVDGVRHGAIFRTALMDTLYKFDP